MAPTSLEGTGWPGGERRGTQLNGINLSPGLFLDSGWLRVLGAGGHPRFCRSLPAWNEGRSEGFYLIADDAVGGSFALNGGALGADRGKVYYYAPDALRWEACDFGYSEF